MNTFHPTAASYKQGAKTLSGKYYTSQAIFDREQSRIFAKQWNCVGRASRLKKPGDYFLATVAGESLIIVKDSKGNINALFNVCRHRGTRVCELAQGHFLKHIQCDYHAWTYDTEGKLVTAPHMFEAKQFEPNNYGLFKAQIAQWQGFLFVTIDQNAKPFTTDYKTIISQLERFNLNDVEVGHKASYDVAANWKLLFQNYNECLHCPTMHPQLAVTIPFESSTNDLTDGPFVGGPIQIRPPFKSATIDGSACGRYLHSDTVKNDGNLAYYYTLMPNMFLSIHPDYVNYYIIHPVDLNHTRVESEWMFHPDTLSDPNNNIKGAIEFWDVTNRQDWQIVERNQLGVTSSRYTPGPYSPRESIPAAWDREYLRSMK